MITQIGAKICHPGSTMKQRPIIVYLNQDFMEINPFLLFLRRWSQRLSKMAPILIIIHIWDINEVVL